MEFQYGTLTKMLEKTQSGEGAKLYILGSENRPFFLFFLDKASNNCSDLKQYFHGTLPLTIPDIQ